MLPRLANRQQLVLFTDGEASYASLFPEIFGEAYHPSRKGNCGRFPDRCYRIPRTLAHVPIVKHRQRSRVVDVEIRFVHGSQRCVQQVLKHLNYTTPNTSAIEWRNGTARRMNAYQVRKSLAFARRSDTKPAIGWWALTVYNWSRPHRALSLALPQPKAKKVRAAHLAMAPRLTDRIWSIRELLLTPSSRREGEIISLRKQFKFVQFLRRLALTAQLIVRICFDCSIR